MALGPLLHIRPSYTLFPDGYVCLSLIFSSLFFRFFHSSIISRVCCHHYFLSAPLVDKWLGFLQCRVLIFKSSIQAELKRDECVIFCNMLGNFFMFVVSLVDVWSSHFSAACFLIFISISKIHALVPTPFPGFALMLHSKITLQFPSWPMVYWGQYFSFGQQ